MSGDDNLVDTLKIDVLPMQGHDLRVFDGYKDRGAPHCSCCACITYKLSAVYIKREVPGRHIDCAKRRVGGVV